MPALLYFFSPQQYTPIAMEDGSRVRIKVAQYFVNKKLQALDSQNPQIKLKLNNQPFLHTLPEFERAVDQPHRGPDELRQLPPIDPSAPPPSWKRLLNLEQARIDGESTRHIRPIPAWYRVAIIGAGVAGLRTAMLLQSKGIPYEIFEASDRPGGRIFTYQFAPKNPQGKHDYHDVGAMRFPDNNANAETFKLFKELGLSSKMIEYVLSNDENIRYYNSEC
jgi:hypothetical protein